MYFYSMKISKNICINCQQNLHINLRLWLTLWVKIQFVQQVTPRGTRDRRMISEISCIITVRLRTPIITVRLHSPVILTCTAIKFFRSPFIRSGELQDSESGSRAGVESTEECLDGPEGDKPTRGQRHQGQGPEGSPRWLSLPRSTSGGCTEI